MKIGDYGLDSMLAVTVDYTSYPFQTNSKITSAGKELFLDRLLGLKKMIENTTNMEQKLLV